jgi:hypothetical protein
MILTPEQAQLKKAFRNAVLKHWRDADRFKMFNIVPTMRVDGQFNLSPVDIYIKIKELPSIRGFWDTMPVAAWLAKHYPKTSSALFAGADDAKALAIWKDEKYTVAATVRRSNAARRHSCTYAVFETGTLRRVGTRVRQRRNVSRTDAVWT